MHGHAQTVRRAHSSFSASTAGGATPRVLGRGQQLVAKGVALRRPWAPKAPDAP